MPDHHVHLDLARRRADLADAITRLDHLVRAKLQVRARLRHSLQVNAIPIAMVAVALTACFVLLRTFLRRA